jgi:solute carrier family 25 oxoglutarate transporter 11
VHALRAQPSPLWQKAGAGLAAGGLGALVGSPADLSLIRMQADATVPLAQRRNYKGVGDAMVRSPLRNLLASILPPPPP